MTISREALRALPAGTRIWRWWDNGIEAEQNPFTLVRVNRLTVTVENIRGEHVRLPIGEVEDVVDWDERR